MYNENMAQRGVADALKEQLGKGFARLYFDPHIERGFQFDYAQQSRPHRLALICLSLLSVAVVVVLDSLVFELPERLAQVAWPLQLGLIMPTLLLALAAALIPRWQAWSEVSLMLGVVTLSLATMAMRSVAADEGYQVPLEYTATAVVAVFFLGRVVLWHYLPVVLMLACLLVLNEFLFVQPGLDGWYRLAINLTLIAIAAGGGYSFEYVVRQSWLNSRLLEQLSNQDPLTGLLNRRAFNDIAMRGLRQASREQRSIGVALLDIDQFKAYNDNYGHAAGDECLRQVADLLVGLANRPLDGCGRYGGEEFVIAWFDGEPKTLQQLAESTLERIRALNIPHAHSTVEPHLTASIGLVTVVPNAFTSLDDLLEVADQAMYQAKRQGRDRMVVQHLLGQNVSSLLGRRLMQSAQEA